MRPPIRLWTGQPADARLCAVSALFTGMVNSRSAADAIRVDERELEPVAADAGSPLIVAMIHTPEAARRICAGLSITRPLTADAVDAAREPGVAEGYALVTSAEGGGTMVVLGEDERGVLYGLGRLLRIMEIEPGSLRMPPDVCIADAPASRIRGHQLGYRPKTNAYDLWTKEQFRSYIGDLAVFGANTIEILPPTTDDEPPTPQMLYDPLEMMQFLSGEIGALGLDVSLWYPNLGDDYSSPSAIAEQLAERETVFAALPRLDHLMIPAGDPGNLDPELLFEWVGRVDGILRRYHPGATIWLAPQFKDSSAEVLDTFLAGVACRPEWLGGLVHGPWVKWSPAELVAKTDGRYPVRRYPDITHSFNCQYPVPRWDPAFLVTLGREGYNPRPHDMKRIHNRDAESVVGSITYSEGINDDVNKFIWADQDWNPRTDVTATLEEYSRLFVSPRQASETACAIARFEEHWDGPLGRTGPAVRQTYRRWRTIGTILRRTPETYRYVMARLRASCDEYLRRRWRWESAHEEAVLALIEQATVHNVGDTVLQCRRMIDAGESEQFAALRQEIDRWADHAFERIRWQTTVSRHGGQSVVRGAFLDAIGKPITDLAFFRRELASAASSAASEDALAHLRRARERACPAPGLRHADFGRSVWAAEDETQYIGTIFADYNKTVPDDAELPIYPMIEQTFLTAGYGRPCSFQMQGLDPDGRYRLRVCYARDRRHPAAVELRAGTHIVHPYRDVPESPVTRVFDPPAGSIGRDGVLDLSWRNDRETPYGSGVCWLALDLMDDR